jgi:hypothetical protein
MQNQKVKRRWLRFSIRTLLVAVTIFCVWLGWEWRIVENRNSVRHHFSRRVSFGHAEDVDPFGQPVPAHLSWIREAMGDSLVWSLDYDCENVGEPEVERIRQAFPELQYEFVRNIDSRTSGSTSGEELFADDPFGGQ